MTGDTLRFRAEQENRTTLRVPRPVDIVQVQTTATTVFTARSDADFQIEALVASNVTGTADYVTVHLVPDGGTAGAGNMIAYQMAIPAKSWVTLFDKTAAGMLQPGMTIQAFCGVNNAVNVWGFGYDYQGQYS